MAKKAAKPPRLTHQQVDAIRIGPIAEQVKQSVSHAQWKDIVARAHKGGFSVNSYLDQGTPKPLKERMPSALRNQAISTIKTAYQPVYGELNDQQKRVQALDSKRKADDAYYRNWLMTKTTQLNAGAQAADRAISANQAGLQREINQTFSAMHAQQETASAARPGNVSVGPNAQTDALAANVQQHDASLMQNQRQLGLDTAATSTQARSMQAANNLAGSLALDAKRQADTYTELSKIGDAKHKAVLSQAADTAKEVARLLDQEITKANANRDFAAAIQRLGIQQQTADLGTQKAAETARHNKASESARLQGLQNDSDWHAAQLAIDKDHNAIGWYNARHKGAAKLPSYGAQVHGVTNLALDRGLAILQSFQRTVPGKAQKVGSFSLNGPSKKVPLTQRDVINARADYAARLISKGLDPTVANAAVEVFIGIGHAGGPELMHSQNPAYLKQLHYYNLFLHKRTG